MDMLKINESLATDESIEEYEYHEYEPITGSNLNTPEKLGSLYRRRTYFITPVKVTYYSKVSW